MFYSALENSDSFKFARSDIFYISPLKPNDGKKIHGNLFPRSRERKKIMRYRKFMFCGRIVLRRKSQKRVPESKCVAQVGN